MAPNSVSILILKHRHELVTDCHQLESSIADCPIIGPDCECCRLIGQALISSVLMHALCCIKCVYGHSTISWHYSLHTFCLSINSSVLAIFPTTEALNKQYFNPCYL